MSDHIVLRAEALAILRETSLLALLAPFGEVRVVGSVALDLVVKPDIDVHVLTPEHDLLAVVDRIYHRLLELPRVREVRITDWRDEGGIKIGIDAYPGLSGTWSVDIWVTDRLETTAFAYVECLLAALTPEMRHAILEIKRANYARGLLRNGLSLRIYRAVVDGGVRSEDEFAAWGP